MTASETLKSLVSALNAEGLGRWEAATWHASRQARDYVGLAVPDGATAEEPWCCEVRGAAVPAESPGCGYCYSGLAAVGYGADLESAARACLEDYCSPSQGLPLPVPARFKASSPEELALRLAVLSKEGEP